MRYPGDKIWAKKNFNRRGYNEMCQCDAESAKFSFEISQSSKLLNTLRMQHSKIYALHSSMSWNNRVCRLPVKSWNKSSQKSEKYNKVGAKTRRLIVCLSMRSYDAFEMVRPWNKHRGLSIKGTTGDEALMKNRGWGTRLKRKKLGEEQRESK